MIWNSASNATFCSKFDRLPEDPVRKVWFVSLLYLVLPDCKTSVIFLHHHRLRFPRGRTPLQPERFLDVATVTTVLAPQIRLLLAMLLWKAGKSSE
jgi:hypothetical protein